MPATAVVPDDVTTCSDPVAMQEFADVRDQLAQRVAGGRLLLVTLGGSRAHGLARPDSDVDLRGTWAVEPDRLLGLGSHRQTLEVPGRDTVLHEAAKLLGGVLAANPSMLEGLFGPVVHADPLAADLLSHRDLLLSARVRRTHGGFARNQLRAAASQDDPRKRRKSLLHAYRVLEQGRRLLREGTLDLAVDPELARTLNAWSGEDDATVHADRFERLRAELDAQPTELPDKPDSELANDLLVDLRRQMLAV